MNELRARGVPMGSLEADTISTSFDTWRLLSAEEARSYPSAFGIQADMATHQIFEFSKGCYRYRIPAIVLVRALLKNRASLMTAIYRPQGLERAITPLFEGERLESCVNSESSRLGVNNDFLLWLYGYPSARKMFHSAYEHLMHGRIGLTLPQGTVIARSTFFAESPVHEVRYVTELKIGYLKTAELPLEFLARKLPAIHFHGAIGGKRQNVYDDECSFGADGRGGLSDVEWSEIQPLIAGIPSCRDSRALLDGILYKLGTGLIWRTCPFPDGAWRYAAEFYRLLNRRWPEIMKVLWQHRTSGRPAGRSGGFDQTLRLPG
jgi:hypothetical protein